MRDTWRTLVDVWRFTMNDPPTRRWLAGIVVAYEIVALLFVVNRYLG